ncbi:hypothetical protein BDF22DRAFT_691761 [Syncephalis plumigaleata]|nr:hypothetical protein BDF22DRAFT_691761 [Syncephalis plumigaleata]
MTTISATSATSATTSTTSVFIIMLVLHVHLGVQLVSIVYAKKRERRRERDKCLSGGVHHYIHGSLMCMYLYSRKFL